MRIFGIVLLSVIGVGLAALVLLLGGGFLFLRSSLPPTDGNVTMAGLERPVSIERDGLGVPVIRGESLADVLRGQGFVHGQDRFFQMDLLRRQVAGELAELVGEAALGADRTSVRYDYRAAAERHVANLPPRQMALLTAYSDGVNAGLRSLRRSPPEYPVLRVDPRPWSPEDSVLAFLHFYTALSTHYQLERGLLHLEAAAPPELFDFLTPSTTRWDRPVVPASDPTGGWEPLPIPGPEVMVQAAAQSGAEATSSAVWNDHRTPLPEGFKRRGFDPQGFDQGTFSAGGSNAWVLPGQGGPALLANDPHLPLSVPGVWYRVELHWNGRRAVGVTPPGLPGIFGGMTEDLAWGVTAAIVDQTDLVVLEMHPEDSLSYRTPAGWQEVEQVPRVVQVRGRDTPDTVWVERTEWGPVRFQEPDGTRLVLRSPAHDEGGVSFSHLDILEAERLEDAMEALRELGGPGISLLLAEATGRMGWIVTGVLPNRVGTDGQVPSAGWGTGVVRWDGVRPEAERPMAIVGVAGDEAAGGAGWEGVPEDAGGAGFDVRRGLQSANQRLLPVEEARGFSHVWMPATRSYRIRTLLSRGPGLEEADHLAMQLDVESPLHQAFRELLLEALPADWAEADGEDAEEADEGLQALEALREAVEAWGGTAAADDPHFPVIHRAWGQVREDVLDRLLEPVRAVNPSVRYRWPLSDEVVLRVLEEEPDHLVPGGYDKWEAFYRSRLVEVAQALGLPDAQEPDVWGDENRARIAHPFGQLAPGLGRFLNLPADPLDGWSGTLRANLPDYGQSFRMVARPGDFDSALFQMPGGQSGHPLSRWYRAGHQAWLEGEATPLAAGPAEHVLVLEPE